MDIPTPQSQLFLDLGLRPPSEIFETLGLENPFPISPPFINDILLHIAVSAYFSGNQSALEARMKQFSIKVHSPNSATPSWIEQ